MERWFDGVYLLGQLGRSRTGCWLLAHGGEAAVLEVPRRDAEEVGAAELAVAAARELGVEVRLVLCSHAHNDSFWPPTLDELLSAFPQSRAVLQRGFRRWLGDVPRVEYFDAEAALAVGGEPLFLAHAPKHSHTDTFVVFRGAVCTGGWELGTLRSLHEGPFPHVVPVPMRLESVHRMVTFQARHGYGIHRVFSACADVRREGVDFSALMASTRTP